MGEGYGRLEGTVQNMEKLLERWTIACEDVSEKWRQPKLLVVRSY
jgi:hypothetical protein